MTASLPAPVVEHQPEQHRFICDTGNGVAEMTYQLKGSVVDFDHTYVPGTARGRGIAALLVDAGVAWARAQGFSLQPSCTYVRTYLRLD